MKIERHFLAAPDTVKELVEQAYAELADIKGLRDFCRVNMEQNTAIVMISSDP